MQRVVGSKIARFRTRIAAQTDARVKLMHDILSGSEALKVNVWEVAGDHRSHMRKTHVHVHALAHAYAYAYAWSLSDRERSRGVSRHCALPSRA